MDRDPVMDIHSLPRKRTIQNDTSLIGSNESVHGAAVLSGVIHGTLSKKFAPQKHLPMFESQIDAKIHPLFFALVESLDASRPTKL